MANQVLSPMSPQRFRYPFKSKEKLIVICFPIALAPAPRIRMLMTKSHQFRDDHIVLAQQICISI